MKASKTSVTYTILGGIVAVFGFIFGRIGQNDYVFHLGLTGMNLMWIMGIQHDLYLRKKE